MTAVTLSLPRLQQMSPLVDETGSPTSSFHIWWDNFAKNIESSFNNLAAQVDDDTLTPSKKSIWIALYDTLTSEQSGIDTQASTYGITTEKTAYDNAITALTSYLATLTAPVAWNDLTGNTAITGATFRTDFQNVLTAKQTLLTKIDNVSGVLSVMINPPPMLTIHADSSGNIKSGELPATLPISANNGTTNLTSLGTWGVTVPTGITCSINSSGVFTLTAINTSETYISVSFTYAGAVRYTTVHVLVVSDPPTNSGSSGSSGSSASTSTIGHTTGSSYDLVNAISATITVTAGSAGQVALSAPLSYKSTDGTSTVTATAKWQYNSAGTWVIVGSAVTGTSNDYVTIDESTGSTKEAAGSVSVSATQTGLTSGTAYQFRLAWKDAGTGNCRCVSGTMTGTGS